MFDRIDYLTHNKELMGEVYFMHPPVSGYDKPLSLDYLKLMKEGLITALEKPCVINELGQLALDLYNTTQMLEPMKYVEGEELGDSHPDSDWTDKNIIPLVSSDKFVVSGRQISPMPVQKDRISDTFASESSARMCIDDIYRALDSYPPTKIERTDVGGFCSNSIYNMGNSRVYLRPIVSVARNVLMCINITALAHETSHAHDCVTNPVLEVCSNDSKEILCFELRAYAVSKVLQDYLKRDQGIRFIYPSISDRVEKVRRNVNGSLLSEDAFDVNDDLIKQLYRAGLRDIY